MNVVQAEPPRSSALNDLSRSLEDRGLSVVVVVAMKASTAGVPRRHVVRRVRNALLSSGLPVLYDAAGDLAERDDDDRMVVMTPEEAVGQDLDDVVDIGLFQRSDAPVIVLSSADDRAEAGGAGATTRSRHVVTTNGAHALPPDLSGTMARQAHPSGHRPLGKDRAAGQAAAAELGLTNREIEVIRAFANGATAAEVVRALYVSPKTVKNHLAHIYAKMDVVNRTQAVSKAVKLGIVDLS